LYSETTLGVSPYYAFGTGNSKVTVRVVSNRASASRIWRKLELSEYLCKHLGKRKIILVAHSFGTVLGLRMIQEEPDLFFAYIGTGEVADETRNYADAYDALSKKARATGNQQALDELKSVGRPPYASGRGYQVQRKWSNLFEGSYRFLYGTLGLTLVAPVTL
jgi:pimeloyl-ACP methyl ester carboxylesterase